VERWLAGAELASQLLRGAIKDAWFGHEARGDFAHVDAAFWSATEAPFYRHLQALIDAARSGSDGDTLPTREAWHATLVQTARRLFDQVFVGTGAIDRQNPRRVALAWQQLNRNLHGRKLRLALGLPVPETASKADGKSTRTKARKGQDNATKEPA
jgi:CRISPR system Cascade subunit CasA